MPRSIVHWSDPVAPSARLFCIAHAGAGAARFRPWAPILPDVALWAARLAGRESRVLEPPLRDLNSVVAELLEDLAEAPGEPVPLALFGHCSGAYVALALAQELAAQGAPPLHLVVAGQVAPGASGPDELYEPPDARALAEQALGGGIVDADFAELLVAAIEADLEMIEGIETRASEATLTTPITAVVGTEDPLAREQLAAWRHTTNAGFALLELPGEHLLDESWERLAELISVVIKQPCQ